ncbi:MAG: anaerobic ribonucleoside-triphosphate reductase [Bacillota bacterium]|nr:anaerobic ribonucleoside-triphosphate reductase [Bacillota bacterium]
MKEEYPVKTEQKLSLENVYREIRKRDGRVVPFDPEKITEAIFKAAQAVGGSNRTIAENLTRQVIESLRDKIPGGVIPTVEDVQDSVEVALIENGHARTAKAYILYRDRRTRIREGKSELMDVVKEILIETNREKGGFNSSPSAKMIQIATAASKQYYLSNLLPEEFARAHEEGSLYIDHLDYYSKTLNSLHINIINLLQQGFDAGCGYIRPPKRFSSAAAQAAIIFQNSQNDMSGGQSFPHFDHSMGEVIRNLECKPDYEEIYQAMEGLITTLNSVHSQAGVGIPFSSMNIGTDTSEEGRMISRAILEAFLNGLGRGATPLRPDLIFRVKKGINFAPEDPNYDLYRMALRVTANRMNPSYSFMDSSFNSKYGDEVSYMGCGTRIGENRHGLEIAAGRGNIASVVMNLPRIAFECRGREEIFFVQLDRLIRIAAKQLLHRFAVLARLKVSDLPFIMGQKLYLESDNLSSEDSIGEAIKQGTLAVGFVGLAEAVHLLCGRHHGEDNSALELAWRIVDHMRRRIDSYADEYDLNMALLGTSSPGLSGKFAAMDREHYGAVPDVTTRGCYSDSFYIPPYYALTMTEKITVEGSFHHFCNAGHISYIELTGPPGDKIDLVDQIIHQMVSADIGLGGINFPLDECMKCSHQGVFNNNCPYCGSTRLRRIRRVSGRLMTEEHFNEQITEELKERRAHFEPGDES